MFFYYYTFSKKEQYFGEKIQWKLKIQNQNKITFFYDNIYILMSNDYLKDDTFILIVFFSLIQNQKLIFRT